MLRDKSSLCKIGPGSKIAAPVALKSLWQSQFKGIAKTTRVVKKQRLSRRFDLPTVRVLPGDVRCRVCEGLSPNTLRYSTEKRPSSAKPNDIAISVTVANLQSADKRARLAWDNRNVRSCLHGGMP
jgi:hypothetical protein